MSQAKGGWKIAEKGMPEGFFEGPNTPESLAEGSGSVPERLPSASREAPSLSGEGRKPGKERRAVLGDTPEIDPEGSASPPEGLPEPSGEPGEVSGSARQSLPEGRRVCADHRDGGPGAGSIPGDVPMMGQCRPVAFASCPREAPTCLPGSWRWRAWLSDITGSWPTRAPGVMLDACERVDGWCFGPDLGARPCPKCYSMVDGPWSWSRPGAVEGWGFHTPVTARHAAFLAARRLPIGPSYPELGAAFNRDHTTVLQGIRKAERRERIWRDLPSAPETNPPRWKSWEISGPPRPGELVLLPHLPIQRDGPGVARALRQDLPGALGRAELRARLHPMGASAFGARCLAADLGSPACRQPMGLPRRPEPDGSALMVQRHTGTALAPWRPSAWWLRLSIGLILGVTFLVATHRRPDDNVPVRDWHGVECQVERLSGPLEAVYYVPPKGFEVAGFSGTGTELQVMVCPAAHCRACPPPPSCLEASK